MIMPMPLPTPLNLNSIPDPQWMLRKMRPTSLGDNKHAHRIAYWEMEEVVAAKQAADTAKGMADLKAEAILSDDGSVPIIDDKVGQ